MHVLLFVCQSYDKERPDLHCSLLLDVDKAHTFRKGSRVMMKIRV